MRILFFLFCFSLLSACQSDKLMNCDPENIRAIYENDKKIEKAITLDGRLVYGTKNGHQTVFRYTRTAEQCDDIYDDEYGEVLTFEVALDSSVTNFEFREDELLDLKCYYFEFGAWVNSGTHYVVRQGVIKGQQTGEDEWYIECSVLTDAIPEEGVPHAVEVNAHFKLE
jgi:hypothetical protein